MPSFSTLDANFSTTSLYITQISFHKLLDIMYLDIYLEPFYDTDDDDGGGDGGGGSDDGGGGGGGSSLWWKW